MEYAHSVIVTLKKGKEFPIEISYNGNAKDYIHAVWIGELPFEEQKAFKNLVLNWDDKMAGLFVDYDSVIGFVIPKGISVTRLAKDASLYPPRNVQFE